MKHCILHRLATAGHIGQVSIQITSAIPRRGEMSGASQKGLISDVFYPHPWLNWAESERRTSIRGATIVSFSDCTASGPQKPIAAAYNLRCAQSVVVFSEEVFSYPAESCCRSLMHTTSQSLGYRCPLTNLYCSLRQLMELSAATWYQSEFHICLFCDFSPSFIFFPVPSTGAFKPLKLLTAVS